MLDLIGIAHSARSPVELALDWMSSLQDSGGGNYSRTTGFFYRINPGIRSPSSGEFMV